MRAYAFQRDTVYPPFASAEVARAIGGGQFSTDLWYSCITDSASFPLGEEKKSTPLGAHDSILRLITTPIRAANIAAGFGCGALAGSIDNAITDVVNLREA